MTGNLLFLFGLTLIFVGVAAVGVLWAIRTGQFDDMEGPAQRILMDDDDPMIPRPPLKSDVPLKSDDEPNKIRQ